MSVSSQYLLDANVFIEAARRYYAFDLVPSFWNKLVSLASNGDILSIDRVKKELEGRRDDLANWVKGSFHPYFVSTNRSDVIQAYREIMEWARVHPRYADAAKAKFADVENADAWLIAYKATGGTVVTHEQPAPLSKNEIKIPDACNAARVAWTDPFAMLRALGVSLP